MPNTKKTEEQEHKDQPKSTKPSETQKKDAETLEAGTKIASTTTKTPTDKVPAKTKRAPLVPKTIFAEQGKYSGWKLIDAKGQTLGRLSSYIAQVLMGKNKAAYTRFHDTGDTVVVINIEKIKLTGNKLNDKTYYHHTGFPGGIKDVTAKVLLETYPERLLEKAVHGMLPTGHMGRRWRKKLLVYKGATHPHTAQLPELVKLPDLGTWQ